MSSPLTPSRRREIAALFGMNEQYLYQCLTGRRDMKPADARRLEDETAGEVRRWHVCQKQWYLIWPELVGADGAPAVDDSANLTKAA